jgi:hypothetical protein
MNPKLSLFFNSIGCGLCLTAFTLVPGLIQYAFSLVAFLLGMRFFGVHDTWGMRIGLVACSILFFLLFLVIYTVLAQVNGWYHPQIPAK